MKGFITNIWSFISGTITGVLGGLIGLGGAEFRLPVLVRYFEFTTFQGIIINLIVSLITVAFSFIFRSTSIPLVDIGENYGVIVNILAGSISGAFVGVRLAVFPAKRLYKPVLAVDELMSIPALLAEFSCIDRSPMPGLNAYSPSVLYHNVKSAPGPTIRTGCGYIF